MHVSDTRPKPVLVQKPVRMLYLITGAQVNTGLILTQPGNLKCQKILHVVGQRDPVKVNKIVDDALQMCLKGSYRSVSFPAIGTGEILQFSPVSFYVYPWRTSLRYTSPPQKKWDIPTRSNLVHRINNLIKKGSMDPIIVILLLSTHTPAKYPKPSVSHRSLLCFYLD